MVRLGSWVVLLLSISPACGGRTVPLDFEEGSGGASLSGGQRPVPTGGMPIVSGGVGASGAGIGTGGASPTTGGASPTTGGASPTTGGSPATGGASPPTSGGASAGRGGQGQAGTDPGVPRCVPGASVACACSSGLTGVQTCNALGVYDPCQCEKGTLAWFRQQLVGDWAGTRQSPWDGAPAVTLRFNADGTWTGTCSGENSIFYWGATPSSGVYGLVAVNTDPEAVGELSVGFGPGLGSQRGALRHIRFSADQSQLWFEFWATWSGEYGPLEFDLSRQ